MRYLPKNSVFQRVCAVAFIALLMTLSHACRSESVYHAEPKVAMALNRMIGNFTSLEIIPGDDGYFSFCIKNVLNNTIANVSVIAEIYCYMTEDKFMAIGDVENNPVFDDGSVKKSIYFSSLAANQTVRECFHVITYKKTPEGAYAVRFSIEFNEGNRTYVLKSVGYFGPELWNRAVQEEGVNYTMLNVSGVVPEYLFGVHKPRNMVPFYALIAITGVGVVVLYILYMNERTGKYGRAVVFMMKTYAYFLIFCNDLKRKVLSVLEGIKRGLSAFLRKR